MSPRRAAPRIRATLLAPCAAALLAGAVEARDCDRNGVEDAIEVESAASPDCNGNSIPDACDLDPLQWTLGEPVQTVVMRFNARRAAIADLQGDGHPDVVLAANPGRVGRVLLGLGTGSFGQEFAFEFNGDGASSLVAVELTGDDRPEVAVLSEASNGRALLAVFENRGDGSLDAPEEPFTLPGPSLLAAGDLDADGDADLLAASDQTLSFFSNQGMGLFSSRSAGDFPWRSSSSLLEADLDGDGDLDAALSSPSAEGTFVLSNDGRGAFSRLQYLQASGHEPFDLAAADLEGDGDLDLFSLETVPGESFQVFRNERGDFAPLAGYQAGPAPRSLAVTDVDGDGLADLVTLHDFYSCTSVFGELRLRRGKGDGTFLNPLTRKVEGPGQGLWTADFDQDQDVDLLTLSSSVLLQSLSVSLGQQGPASADANANGVPDECELGAADCDGNGVLDAADIANGGSPDCNLNGVPDRCEADCNRNGTADDCDLASGASADADGNGIPDECQSRAGDCNEDGRPDAVEIANGQDCDGNGILDSCEVTPFFRFSQRIASRHPLPGPPGSAASADLDLDGDLDAAVTTRAECCSPAPGAVSVFLNHGDARFAAAGTYAVDGDPDSVAAADVTADGAPDLAVATRSLTCREGRRMRIFANRGAGSFQRGETFSFPWEPRGLDTEDFDGDGDIDLAVGNDAPLARSVSVYWNEERGRFAPGGSFGPAAGALAIATSDWNRDGHADIAVAGSNPGGVWILLGASFERDLTVEGPLLPGSVQPGALAAGDLDGDGDPDLVVGESDPHSLRPPVVSIHGNAGDGTFPASTSYSTAGRPDSLILWESQDRREVWLVGPQVDDLPGAAFITPLRGEERPGLGKANAFRAGPPGSSASLGDFDQDRDLDVLVLESMGSFFVVRTTGKDALEPEPRYPLGAQATGIIAADLDGDGRQDLAAADPAAGAVFFLRNSAPLPGVEPSLSVSALSEGMPPRPVAVAAGDIDGDGVSELAVAGSFRASFFRHRGDGAFSQAGNLVIGSNPVRAILLDVDGDGDLDLATANSLVEGVADNVTIAFNDGKGAFNEIRNHAAGREPFEFLAGDLDADGAPDLVTFNERPSEVVVLWNRGDGTFTESVALPFRGWAIVATDLDQDGDGDLIASNETTLDMLRNQGQRLFVHVSFTYPWHLYADLESADQDGDGDLDLLGGSQDGLDVLRNRGDGNVDGAGSFQFRTGLPYFPLGGGSGGSPPFSGPPPPMSIAVTDLDGDGDPDVAVGFPDHAGFLLNHTSRARPDGNGDAIPDVCQASPDASFRRADANGDRKIDLTDAVRVLWHLFLGGEDLPCRKAADADDTGRLDLADPVTILRFLFLGESPPSPPFPGCDLDPTPDLLDCLGSAGC